MLAAGAVSDNAVFNMSSREFRTDLVDGRPGGTNLSENVDAINVFVDHAADTAHLTL